MRRPAIDLRIVLLALVATLPACQDERNAAADEPTEQAAPATRPGPDPLALPSASAAAKKPATRAVAAPVAMPPAAPAPMCADCGVVTRIQSYRVEGQGSGVGAVAGAVVGGLLGNQVGGGSGKKIATVAGAAGGAYAGHEIEKRQRAGTTYQVDVRMENGNTVTLDYANPPTLSEGQKVRVSGGVAVPQ
ncbi:MAG: glycine zipper 2TM domain-containing protein [Immundisolibacter sp.]|uniref:glycine zipper 2TM domain-containing protein n=1 Tax=Immundisolibacter sp. TaxID=1934948 RepID=UPI003EE25A89